MLQGVHELPGTRHLPADVFPGQSLGHGRLADLIGRLLQEKPSIVRIGELGQRHHVAPGLRSDNIPRPLTSQHLQRRDLLQKSPAASNLRRQFRRRLMGEIDWNQRAGHVVGKIGLQRLPGLV